LGGESISEGVVAIDLDGAGVGFDEAVDHAERSGFASTIGAE
jgi:hypothetical protein